MVGTSCKQPQRQPQKAGLPSSSNVRGPQKQQQHQHSHRQHHPKKFSANGIPAIQITQMTMDEGDEEPSGTPPMQQPVKKGSDSSADARTESTSVDARSPKLVCHADNAGMPEAGHLIYPKQSSGSGAQTADNSALLSANKYQDRSAVNRQSTGTLNRLILVAQALENEVDWRRRNDINSSRIVFTLRMANIVLLLLVNLLLFTGVGQYHDRNGTRISLFLTIDKWYYRSGFPLDEVPPTFSDMRLTGQFCAAGLAVAMLLATMLLQCIHCFHVRHPKLLCVFYAFGCVPVALFIFGLEMHYSACPWLDDFYQTQLLRRNFNSMEKYFDTQCGVNGWALAGIFSLLSCGLFVSDGLISVFFRADDTHGSGEQEKPEAML